MDDPDDITTFLPHWQEQPTPFQSNEPEAPQQLHGVGDDVWLDTTTDGEYPPDAGMPLLNLGSDGSDGPAPSSSSSSSSSGSSESSSSSSSASSDSSSLSSSSSSSL